MRTLPLMILYPKVRIPMLNRQKPTQQVLMLIRLAQPETKICQAQSGVLSIR